MHKHNLSGVAFCGNEGDFFNQEEAINPALLKYEDQPWYDKISEQGLKNLFSGKLDRFPNSYTYDHLKNVDLEALFNEEQVESPKKHKRSDEKKSDLPRWLKNVGDTADIDAS